ncbi:uncharacterized protein MELLADRAFT_108710 [Melampsora larici-populina 98AG31]|uniref:DASH complex subunit DUO1 n=1 Tax=Melampsora larici-populina (strain 98AG31 / pathotype 3-4-7) TaxID=747676 RepID=F4RTZ7_MELLP|nr:uncharacterized protein MELLADRAFT_108710 [Melampsora larici-populina 98AG31]EGG04090.1 hypothetical protein MELLADRAFT_108710 [Melampsora larici-populina 98AG31]
MSRKPKPSISFPPNLSEEDDFLNDSISMNLNEDDSFLGNPIINTPSRSQNPTKRQMSEISNPIESNIKKKKEPNQSNSKLNHKWKEENQRNQELEEERDFLKGINDLLEIAADDLDSIPEKIQRVQQASETSHNLLDLYSKILSKTEEFRETLIDPNWKGLSEDIKRRDELKLKEIQLKREKEIEIERQRLAEIQKRQEEEEQEAERSRSRSNQNQIPRFNSRGTTRGRVARTAGRAVRGTSRIGRIKRS